MFNSLSQNLVEKKAGGDDDDEPLEPEDQNIYLMRTVESLKHKLGITTTLDVTFNN